MTMPSIMTNRNRSILLMPTVLLVLVVAGLHRRTSCNPHDNNNNNNTSAAAVSTTTTTTTTTTTSSSSTEDTTKVHIDLYYESQCPGCRELITGSFSEAYQTSGFLQMAEMTYVPYGNAQEVEEDDDQEYHFDCQHGPSECRYNTIEVCALAKIPGPTQQFDFLQCIEHHDANRAAAQDYAAVTRDCAHRTHVDAAVLTTLQDCVTSSEGNALDHDMAVKTQALDPPHQYVPYLVVNGVHDETSQTAITDSLFRYVCAVYTGPHKSSECPATTMTTTTMTADQEEDNDVTDQPELLTTATTKKKSEAGVCYREASAVLDGTKKHGHANTPSTTTMLLLPTRMAPRHNLLRAK